MAVAAALIMLFLVLVGAAPAAGRAARRRRRRAARAALPQPEPPPVARAADSAPASRTRLRPVSPTPPAVSVRGLVKRYGRTTAVDGLDLELPPATVLALLGPNGAGKTTTVEVCTGFLRADAGEVRVLGVGPGRRPGRAAGPDRGDAAGRRRLPDGARRGDAAAGGRLLGAPAGRALAQLGARPRRLRPHPVQAALRRPAAAADPGLRRGRAPGAGVPGRADRRHGPAGPPAGLGADRRAAPGRGGRAADHAPDGGGRGAGRPGGDRRRGQGGGPGQPDRAHRHRRPAGAAVPGPPRDERAATWPRRCPPATTPPRRSPAATSCRAGSTPACCR